MSIQLIHLTNEATKLVEELANTGFNGVRFLQLKLDAQPWSDWEGDGRTREEYNQWLRDYVYLTAVPDEPYFCDEDVPYVEARQFDRGSFTHDFKKLLRERLGTDLNISVFRGSDDYEIQRIPAAHLEQSR